MTDDDDKLAFERDLAVKQVMLCQADLKVIQMALNENRPLEALRQINDSLDRLDEKLDAITELEDGIDGQEGGGDV